MSGDEEMIGWVSPQQRCRSPFRHSWTDDHLKVMKRRWQCGQNWLLAAGCMSRLWCLRVARSGVRRRECLSRHVATRRWSSSLFWSYFLLLVQHVDKMFHQCSLLAHRRSNYCCISSCFHRAFKVLNFTVKMNCRNLGKLQYKVSSSEYIFILDCYISSQSCFGIFFIRWIYGRWLGSLNWT